MHASPARRVGRIGLLFALLLFSAHSAGATLPPHLGYGFNVAYPTSPLIGQIGFDWVKTFDGAPCPARLPHKVLVRMEEITGTTHLNAVRVKAHSLAQNLTGCAEAFEIGNEPNLDASYGWAAPPVAADYTAALCAAYEEIKAVSPDYSVISAGLAPTGRVQGNWQGHPGHNGAYQDEREFLKEMLTAGAGNCLDAVGYHPYGFSADYDVAPDVPASDPARNCSNGFCFRGAEKIYEIMQSDGLGDKQVWATEFGWIVRPPDPCMSLPEYQPGARGWQLVTEQKQADNLVGAFQYADANWPWMGGLFVFNLDFNTVPSYADCEQMRYYSVAGRMAQAALTTIPKRPVLAAAALSVSTSSIAAMIAVADQPVTRTTPVHIGNTGSMTMTWSAQANTGAALVPALNPVSGTLAPGQSQTMSVTWASTARPIGVYTGAITLTAAPTDTLNAPMTIPLTLFVVHQVYSVYLPLIAK